MQTCPSLETSTQRQAGGSREHSSQEGNRERSTEEGRGARNATVGKGAGWGGHAAAASPGSVRSFPAPCRSLRRAPGAVLAPAGKEEFATDAPYTAPRGRESLQITQCPAVGDQTSQPPTFSRAGHLKGITQSHRRTCEHIRRPAGVTRRAVADCSRTCICW